MKTLITVTLIATTTYSFTSGLAVGLILSIMNLGFIYRIWDNAIRRWWWRRAKN